MLKKSLLIGLLSVAAFISATAQKVYSTKTASVKFYSKTPAEDIEATNSQVDSKLTDKGQMRFNLLIKGFRFDNELMQDHFNSKDWMDSDTYPKAGFVGTITNIANINFAKDGTYPATVSGVLTIRGIAQKMQATGSVVVAKGKISSKSVFKLKVKDFGIKGKDIGTSIANELEITVISKYD